MRLSGHFSFLNQPDSVRSDHFLKTILSWQLSFWVNPSLSSPETTPSQRHQTDLINTLSCRTYHLLSLWMAAMTS